MYTVHCTVQVNVDNNDIICFVQCTERCSLIATVIQIQQRKETEERERERAREPERNERETDLRVTVFESSNEKRISCQFESNRIEYYLLIKQ